MQLKIKLQTAHSAEQHTFFDKIKKKIVPMAELNTANNAIFYYSHENIKKLPFPSHYAIFGNADYLYYFVPNLQLANFCYEQFYELNGGNKFPNEIENSIKTAEINVFSKMKKSEGLNMDVISAKKAYIQEMRVKWAVVDKNAHVEPEIRAFFADSVENKATGQKIYILKSEK
jgi:hypothetical protein